LGSWFGPLAVQLVETEEIYVAWMECRSHWISCSQKHKKCRTCSLLSYMSFAGMWACIIVLESLRGMMKSTCFWYLNSVLRLHKYWSLLDNQNYFELMREDVYQVWYLNQLHTLARSWDTTPNAPPCFVHVNCISNVGGWMKADIVQIGVEMVRKWSIMLPAWCGDMLVGVYHVWFGCVATAAIMRFSAAKKIGR
jgi:hypothetical protein